MARSLGITDLKESNRGSTFSNNDRILQVHVYLRQFVASMRVFVAKRTNGREDGKVDETALFASVPAEQNAHLSRRIHHQDGTNIYAHACNWRFSTEKFGYKLTKICSTMCMVRYIRSQLYSYECVHACTYMPTYMATEISRLFL